MHQISRCGGLQLKGLLERLDLAATGSHLTPTYALRNVVQKESYMYICRTAEKRIKSNLFFLKMEVMMMMMMMMSLSFSPSVIHRAGCYAIWQEQATRRVTVMPTIDACRKAHGERV